MSKNFCKNCWPKKNDSFWVITLAVVDKGLMCRKCSFGRLEVVYLGHKVGGEGISPDPQKSAAISTNPPPTNVKELKPFLGLASYYRRFIRRFSTVAHPFISLLKKRSGIRLAQTS